MRYIAKKDIKNDNRRGYITLNDMFGKRRSVYEHKGRFKLIVKGNNENFTADILSLKFGLNEFLRGIFFQKVLSDKL